MLVEDFLQRVLIANKNSVHDDADSIYRQVSPITHDNFVGVERFGVVPFENYESGEILKSLVIGKAFELEFPPNSANSPSVIISIGRPFELEGASMHAKCA